MKRALWFLLMRASLWPKAAVVGEEKCVAATYFKSRVKKSFGQLNVRCEEKEKSSVTQGFLPKAAKYLMLLFAGEEKALDGVHA